MRGFQLRYVGLVAGALFVMLVFGTFHTMYLTQTVLSPAVAAEYSSIIQSAAWRFFFVGVFFIVVVVLAATFLSHRAVGPTRRIEEELRRMAEDKTNQPLRIRDGDDFESLIEAINQILGKRSQHHR